MTLVAVYVDPDHRGGQHGVLDALLQFIEGWASERGDRITLLVNADNLRARRAYEKRGYQMTGCTFEQPHAPGELKIQMRKGLPRPIRAEGSAALQRSSATPRSHPRVEH